MIGARGTVIVRMLPKWAGTGKYETDEKQGGRQDRRVPWSRIYRWKQKQKAKHYWSTYMSNQTRWITAPIVLRLEVLSSEYDRLGRG